MRTRTQKTVSRFAALVWLVNGLVCKLLNLVPRHQQIVARILGAEHAVLLTRLIGVGEVLMAIWIVSRIRPRFCTAAQIALVSTMNVIEFLTAPDLLLFGRLNIVVAAAFVLLLAASEGFFRTHRSSPTFKEQKN